MRSLYDENGRYTDAASHLEASAENGLRVIFDKYVRDGFSPREISHVLQAGVTMLELMAIIDMPTPLETMLREKVEGRDGIDRVDVPPTRGRTGEK